MRVYEYTYTNTISIQCKSLTNHDTQEWSYKQTAQKFMQISQNVCESIQCEQSTQEFVFFMNEALYL